MNGQAQEPFLPAGTDPFSNRLASGLRELVQALLRSGAFLLRQTIDPIIIPAADRIVALKWGSLNRVFLSGDLRVHLPRLEPRWVGVPLKFLIINDTSNVVELVPTGRRLGSVSTPLINESTTVLRNVVGAYTLENDGQNWFTGAL